MWVLTATTDDPAGKYELAGSLDTQGWAIDGTVLTDMFGNATFVWSGWPTGRNGSQNLYMARMKSPLELAGPPPPPASGHWLTPMRSEPFAC